MTDPKRWLEGGDEASEVERALLRRARDAGAAPPRDRAHDKAAVWASLVAQLPPGALAPAPPSGGAAPGAAKGGLLKAAAGAKVAAAKGVVALAVAGSTVVAGAQLVGTKGHVPPPAQTSAALIEPHTKSPAPTSSSENPPAAAPPEPVAQPVPRVVAYPLSRPPGPRPADEARSLDAPSAPPRSSAPLTADAPPPNPAHAPETPASALREEAAAVAEARNKLRGGDAERALAALDAAARRFPNGTLAEERDALRVEALARRGDRAGAAAAASAFVRAHPNSPHLDHVRSFL